MLPAFEFSRLAAPAALIFMVVLIVSTRLTRSMLLSWGLAAVKTSLFLIYYGIVFDGSYTFLDDWTYLDRGAFLHASGVGVTNLLESLPLLVALGEGDHFVYYLYNALAIHWFGDAYFAPVALNVAATALIAALSTRLAVTEGLIAVRARTGFFCFMMLHPDITVWSTVMNGKDLLVLLLHVVLLTSVSLYMRGRKMPAVVVAGLAVALLLFLRFYVPLLFAIALAATAALQLQGSARWKVLALAFAALAGLGAKLGASGFGFFFDLLLADFVNPVAGLLRFMLTPIPFNTEPAFAFLDLPALLHWLMLPAALLGARQVFRMRTPFSRFLLAYTLVFLALYAVYGELQGPRHRIQLDFVWATMQFVGLGALVSVVSRLQRERMMSRLGARGTP